MTRPSAMRRLCRTGVPATAATGLLLAIGLLLALPSLAAGPRQRYAINPNSVTWPFETLLYYNPRLRLKQCPSCVPPHPESIERAIRAWNAARVGYRFEETNNSANADLWFLGSKFVKPSTCEGEESFPGYDFAQDWIVITGRCDRYMTTLLAAHEIGHFLGLSHVFKGCALMNLHAFEPRGHPELAHPALCPRGKQYWRSPVMPGDRAGVRAVRLRPTRAPYLLCFNASGQWDTALSANDPLCQTQYDCRGVAGTAALPGSTYLNSPGVNSLTDQFAQCRQEPYDKAAARREYHSR